jgi:hypothetical protein
LPNANNTRFTTVTQDNKLYHQGQTISYQCENGYEFTKGDNSNKTLKCNSDGQFEHLEQCTKVGMLTLQHIFNDTIQLLYSG